MHLDLDREPDYTGLLDALLAKTRAGKITWQETADEDTFLAAVHGRQTFEISRHGDFAVLTVRDRDGKLLFRTSQTSLDAANELWRLARRIAMRVDEKIDSALELIKGL